MHYKTGEPVLIGDVVEVIGVQDGFKEALGRTGTVIHVFDDLIGVKFDERFSTRLHSCHQRDLTMSSWGFRFNKIKLCCIEADVDFDSLL